MRPVSPVLHLHLHQGADAAAVWMRTWIECAHAAVRRRYVPASILHLLPESRRQAGPGQRTKDQRPSRHRERWTRGLPLGIDTEWPLSHTCLSLLLVILAGMREEWKEKVWSLKGQLPWSRVILLLHRLCRFLLEKESPKAESARAIHPIPYRRPGTSLPLLS